MTAANRDIRQGSWRQRAARHPATKAVLHPVITLVGLLILFALVFFGTLYQTEHGLWEAQNRFFGYGMVLVGGFFPLPAASLVLWVLSIQLLVTMLFVLPWKLAKLGLWVVHLSIFALLFGGFLTQTMAVESQMTLAEGEEGHYTTSYQDWELAFWESRGDSNQVFAYDAAWLKPGAVLDVAPYASRIQVKTYYRNADAFTTQATKGPKYINPSGIGTVEQRKPDKEVTRNAPAVIFTLTDRSGAGPGGQSAPKEILLYGMEQVPLILTLDKKKVFVQLRLKHFPLDFSLKLTDFVKNVHPGTDMASSFESYADLREGGGSRPVKIWMNNPLRHEGYTFFQASFSQGAGVEKSTFAVVTNPGRVLPYVSSILVFAGMLLHFLLRLVPFIRKEASP